MRDWLMLASQRATSRRLRRDVRLSLLYKPLLDWMSAANLAVEIFSRRRFAAGMQNREPSIQLFCEEPFRVFFPIGLILGIVGVSLWPLYYSGFVNTYPATAHARLMIEGFMASFIIGFLGTAGPRITSTSHFSRRELIALLTLDLLSAGLHFGGAHRAGDVLFVCCLPVFLAAIGKPFVGRKASPPPNFP